MSTTGDKILDTELSKVSVGHGFVLFLKVRAKFGTLLTDYLSTLCEVEYRKSECLENRIVDH